MDKTKAQEILKMAEGSRFAAGQILFDLLLKGEITRKQFDELENLIDDILIEIETP